MRQVLRRVFADQTAAAPGSGPDAAAAAVAASGLAPLRVLSLGGGSGNDAVGVVAFLMERVARFGAVETAVAIDPDAVRPRVAQTKLTWAEKKAAKKVLKAGSGGGGGGGGGGFVSPPYSDFLKKLPRTAATGPAPPAPPVPSSAPLPACAAVCCHVLDIEEGWFASVGQFVRHSTSQHRSGNGGGGGGEGPPFAAMHWHQCDVTEQLHCSYPSLQAAASTADPPVHRGACPEGGGREEAAGLDPGGAGLVVASYLFSVHAGPAYTQGYEIPVAAEFWRSGPRHGGTKEMANPCLDPPARHHFGCARERTALLAIRARPQLELLLAICRRRRRGIVPRHSRRRHRVALPDTGCVRVLQPAASRQPGRLVRVGRRLRVEADVAGAGRGVRGGG